MNGVTFSGFGGFHQRFAERRMRMHVARDFCRGQLHALRQSQFGQQLRYIRAYQVRAQNFTVFAVVMILTNPA